jgi:hypothetical protein
VPSWRPAEASRPDGHLENAYDELADVDSALAARLVDRYGRRWLEQATLPIDRLVEVGDTVELLVRGAGNEQVLRFRSWYTGSTYWLDPWDGSEIAAEHWIDEVATLQASNVREDRRHGPTPWDGG